MRFQSIVSVAVVVLASMVAAETCAVCNTHAHASLLCNLGGFAPVTNNDHRSAAQLAAATPRARAGARSKSAVSVRYHCGERFTRWDRVIERLGLYRKCSTEKFMMVLASI